jgi:lariat debranching enzyme
MIGQPVSSIKGTFVSFSRERSFFVTTSTRSVAARCRMRRMSNFRRNQGALGSPPLRGLLKQLKPAWWFAAHLHARYAARVVHDPAAIANAAVAPAPAKAMNQDEIVINDIDLDEAESSSAAPNPDEITLEMDDDTLVASAPTTEHAPTQIATALSPSNSATASSSAPRANPDEILLDDEEAEVIPPPAAAVVHNPPAEVAFGAETRFLALNKCLPGRDFLEVRKCILHCAPHLCHAQVIDYPAPQEPTLDAPPVLTFDPEWLAIVRSFNPFFSRGRAQLPFPPEADARATVARELAWVREHALGDAPSRSVDGVQVFAPTALGGPEGPKRGTRESSSSLRSRGEVVTDVTQHRSTPTRRQRPSVECWRWRTRSTRR